MPLPKPPTRKAAILSQTDFEVQAAPRPGRAGGKPRAEPATGSGPELYLKFAASTCS